MKVLSSGQVYGVAWHPGQVDLLACATSTGGKILNMERPETEALQLGTDRTYWVAWSPAGHLLLTLGQQKQVWNSHGAKVATLLAQPGGWGENPQFNASGSLVAITRVNTPVSRGCHVFDTLTGVLQHSFEIFAGESMVWKDEREFFCCSGMGNITHCRLGQAEPLRIMTGQWALTMAFNPEKGILAFGGHDRTVRLWSSGVTTLTGHTERVVGVVWKSQNSGILASYSLCQVRIWDAIAETNLHVYEGGFIFSSFDSQFSYGMSHISFSPDGRFFAAASLYENVKIVKVSTGKIVAQCEENGIAVSWSRGNNKLAVKSFRYNPVDEAASVYNLENLMGINLKSMSMKCVANLLEKNLTNGKEEAKEFLTNERIPETLISDVLLMFHIKMY